MGEYYAHEIIHLINNSYPYCHTLIKMGLAAYIDDAGSASKSSFFLVAKLKQYSTKRIVNLQDFSTVQYNDEYTDVRYSIGAVMVNSLMRKGGLQLLIECMTKSKDDTELKNFFRNKFGITNFDVFFKAEIDQYLAQKQVQLNID